MNKSPQISLRSPANIISGALLALGLSADEPVRINQEISETSNATTLFINNTLEESDLENNNPQEILDSLKRTYPEIAHADQDDAILSIISELGEDFSEFFKNFGPIGLLAFTLIYFESKKSKKSADLNEHREIRTELEPLLLEARAISDELDQLSTENHHDSSRANLLSIRAVAAVAGILTVIAPLNANASIRDMGKGVSRAWEGTTQGLGRLLETIGQIAETLSYLSYVIDIAVLVILVAVCTKNAYLIEKIWLMIKNNRIRRYLAVKKMMGPRSGTATNLENRPGSLPGDIIAQTSGATLRTSFTAPGIFPNVKPLQNRILDAEIDISQFNELAGDEIHETAREILNILAVDYTLPGAPAFPHAQFNDLVARFNAAVVRLRHIPQIPADKRNFNWKDVVATIILTSSLIIGTGWYKAHYFSNTQSRTNIEKPIKAKHRRPEGVPIITPSSPHPPSVPSDSRNDKIPDKPINIQPEEENPKPLKLKQPNI